MVVYVVFLCPYCSFPRYAREGQKTVECFICGSKISLKNKKTRMLLKTKELDKAITAVKKIKENRQGQIHLYNF